MTGPPLDSRAKILDAAEALFARSGYAGIGMREVADAVGLSKSSLFHHFASKLELYDEVLLRVLARLAEALDPVLRDTRLDPLGRTLGLIDALVDALAEHPSTARLALRSLFEDEVLADPEARRPYEEPLERLIGAFQAQLAEGVRSGVFREISPGHLTQTLIGATVYHFASADLGEEILGAPIFSADQVSERKRELKALVQTGIVSPGSQDPEADAPARRPRA